MNKFKVYSDPGHGWLRVTPKDVYDIGLTKAHFTPFSYRTQDDKFWYLEEDQDAGLFVKVWEKFYNKKISFAEKYCNGQSSIRKKPSLWTYVMWDRDAWQDRIKDLAA